MRIPQLTQRQKWMVATGIGSAYVIYRCFTTLKSPYRSTSSALPKLVSRFPSYKDVVYKEIDGKSLRLDLYMPGSAKRHDTPVLVFIHGGSWTQASKNNIRKTFRQYALHELLRNGFAVASVDYRLADPRRLHIPEQIADCKDAIRWLRKHGEEYGLDTGNIGMWGSSAGGHLALMTAYTDEEMYPGDESLRAISPRVNYVIDTFGPTDLNLLFKTNLNPLLLLAGKLWVKKVIAKRDGQIQCVTGFDINREKERVRQICKEYSPINYVSEHCCPTLIMHGAADKTVKIDQSYRLLHRLRKHKVEVKMVRFGALRHSFCNATPEQAKEVARQIVEFARAHYEIPR